MAGQKFIFDNDVRHLAACFPGKQTIQLEEVGLSRDASDEDIVAVASEGKFIIVTNNRRDFEFEVRNKITSSSKKRFGCTQVHGLVVVLPSESLKQERALLRATRQLWFDGRLVGWKAVNELCLKVIVEESGRAKVSRLLRCPYCDFDDLGETG